MKKYVLLFSLTICFIHLATAQTITPQDDCAGTPPTFTVTSSCVSSTCDLPGASFTASSNLPGTCSGASIVDDGWIRFQATSTSTTISYTSTVRDGALWLYTACPPSAPVNCANSVSGTGTETIVQSTTVGTWYYLRIGRMNGGANANMNGTLCIYQTPTPPANDNCNTLPAYQLTPGVTCSYTAGTSLNGTLSTPAVTCGNNADDDVWFSFVATNTSHQVNVAGAASYNATVEVYSGSCAGLTSLQCVNNFGAGGTETINMTGLTIGNTYYIRVFHNAAGSSATPTFNICVVNGTPCVLGTGVVNVASLPYSISGQTTCGAVNDLTSANVSNYCGTNYYYDGEDAVYVFTPATSGQVNINLTSSTGSYTNLSVHNGCPTAAGSCVAYNQSSTGTKQLTICVSAGVTYYLVIDSWPAPACNPYDLTISAPSGSSGPVNDLPCNASPLTIGTPSTGDNSCATNTSDPAVPGCWSTGIVNSVWYQVICPASGTMKIKTGAGSLHDMQIAVYSGTCSSLTYVNCNQDATDCGSSSNLASELSLTGLTPGATYYIVVDGYNADMGDFSIVVVDGASTYPNVQGQDCITPNPVCNSNFAVSNPGYGGYGFNCDLGSGYCLLSSERSVVWYTIPINASGVLEFDIVPNDFDCASENETDYDFAIWQLDNNTDGNAADGFSCAEIFSGTTATVPPKACNYSFLGVTGVSGTGNAPGSLSGAVCPQCGPCPSYSPTPTYDAAYEPNFAVNSGETYILAVSNFSNSTSGFHIDFLTSPIGYVGSTATSVTWTGGDATVPTAWTDVDNWGGCNIPDCGRDGIIAPFSNQPTISSNVTVKNLVIQAGATLTINPGVTVTVCGDITNNGTLIMDPTATFLFNNTATHTLTGNFTGANKVGNMTVNQTAGSVVLANNIDIAGNLTTSSATSIFNSNGKYVRLAKNLVNFNGNTTYSNTGTTGTLEFNGTTTQTYNQGTSNLDLNFVVMNNTGGIGNGVSLQTSMYIKPTTGTLTLTAGTITTGAFIVQVNNSTPTAVTTGNSTSFVDGNINRVLSGAAGSYDFPVGNVAKGYQRANINFTTATTIPRLQANFVSWPGSPVTQGGSECGTTYNLPAENSGYWVITASANPTSGNYTTTLYPTNATNTTGAASWTVIKSTDGGATWILSGTCAASTSSVVTRTGMNGFSFFAAGQGATPLPIELIEFTGHVEGYRNKLEWATASEQNNDYFTVERSLDGISFEEVGRVPGAGNSNSLLNYSLYDEDPFHPLTYYRLKQTDFNGQYSYSPLVTLLNTSQGKVGLQKIYPNPSEDIFNIVMVSEGINNASIQVVDMYGRPVRNFSYTLQNGEQTLKLDGSGWAAGVYFIRIASENKLLNTVQKVIKE